MAPITEKKLRTLEETASYIREDIITMLAEAKSGHPGGALGMADIFTALYFHILNHNPKKPNWVDRDRVVLSNGHICPVLYASLARAGYFPLEELKTLRKINSRLQGHPHRTALPGLETTSGPLGSGLSQAIGIALAARLDGKKYHTFALLSDGEHQEGNTWEAIMLAGKYKLTNMTAIVDRNNIQIDGYTEDVMPLEPFRSKYEAFNWHVLEVDGHNMVGIISAIAEAKVIYEKPTLIIAHTVPGRGVKYMENNYLWHGIPPGIKEVPGAPGMHEQARVAIKEIRERRERIKHDYHA